MNVLIIDDDADVKEFLSGFVKNEGHLADAASDGEVALSFLKENKYELVLLDLKMPELNGVETLRYIRKSYADIPVVIITAEKECESIKAVKKMGIIDIIYKPFNIEDIRHALKISHKN
jgi:DNA-binding response OmpR family regulator